MVALEEGQAEPESDDRDPIAGLNAWAEVDAAGALDGEPSATRRRKILNPQGYKKADDHQNEEGR